MSCRPPELDGSRFAELHDAVNCPCERNSNGARRYRRICSLGRPAESYLEREHNARWAALGVAHATSGITASVLTLLLPRGSLARDQLNPYLQGAQAKEVEQWQSGADHNVRLHKEQYTGVMQMLDLDATPQEGMIFHCAGQTSGWMASLRHLGFAGRVRPVPTSGSSPNR